MEILQIFLKKTRQENKKQVNYKQGTNEVRSFINYGIFCDILQYTETLNLYIKANFRDHLAH